MISVVLHSDCFKSTTNCRDSAFSLRELEAGLPAFQLPMFSKCDALPKGERFVWHVCLRNPFPLFLLGIPSIHSQPEAGFWEPQYVPPGLHYGCIMPIPSLQLKIKTSLMQRSKGFGHGVVVSKICYVIYRYIQWLCPRFGLQDIDCALSCDTWLLQTNEQLSKLSF